MNDAIISKIKQSLPTASVEQKSVDAYLRIQDAFANSNIDVSTDRDFQKSFKGFYRVRRNDAWCKVYFTLLKKQKTEHKTFPELLKIVHEKTGRFEASFVSKLLATTSTDLPIWDSFVLKNLGISSPTYLKGEEKCNAIISKYNELCSCVKELSELPEMKSAIKKFDKTINRSNDISLTKKIDFILWSIRD